MYLNFHFGTCSFVSFPSWTWHEVIYDVIFATIGCWFLYHLSFTVCALISPHLYGTSIVLHLILGMFNGLMSGIHNKAAPFPGTTKTFMSLVYFWHLFYTWYTPSLEMLVILYVLNAILLSIVWFNWSIVMLGNRFKKTKWDWNTISACIYSNMSFCAFYACYLFLVMWLLLISHYLNLVVLWLPHPCFVICMCVVPLCLLNLLHFVDCSASQVCTC